MLIIRPAVTNEFDKAMKFYYDLTDSMQNAEYEPGWVKGIYPTERFIQDSINEKELFIGVINDIIVSALVMNQDYANGYESVKWKICVNKNELIVIHALVYPQPIKVKVLRNK